MKRTALWLSAALIWSAALPAPQAVRDRAKVRTITAGVSMEDPGSLQAVSDALVFLQRARAQVAQLGYEVQTLRITTNPAHTYLKSRSHEALLEWGIRLERMLKQGGVSAALGPANGMPVETLVEFLSRNDSISLTLTVTDAQGGIDDTAVRDAARIMLALSQRTADGLGNFRFAAIANCPPGIPFFPSGYHEGKERDFSIGFEGAAWVQQAFAGKQRRIREAQEQLRQRILADVQPLEKPLDALGVEAKWKFLGFDLSTAPQGTTSIGAGIEALNGRPIGGPGTLSVVAAVTEVLHTLPVRRCGFSGLMLPILEDATLAHRAAEGRIGIDQLLLYSAVCGTGLDVLPLPGDISEEALGAIIRDVAALSVQWKKPLSVRLLPVPGKKAGDATTFRHPYMVNSKVLALPREP